MRPNPLKRREPGAGPIVNAWLLTPNAVTAEAMARQGFDAVTVDMQHGLIDFRDLVPLLQAISQTDAVPLVRVPWNEPSGIMRALDAGAYGVIVPLVNTAEEAERAVAACRYPPHGIRSFGPTRARLYAGDDYHERALHEILVLVMIETGQGLDNVESICAVPGLDGVYIGPADLSYGLGLEPRMDNEHPAHREAVARIVAACKENGRMAGLHTGEAAFARGAVERGVDLVTIATDLGCLQQEAGRRLRAFRGEGGPER